MQAVLYARAGATFYLLWGLLHLYVAYDLFKFADGVEPLAASARLDQLAAYIGSAAVASIVIAAKSNWWNEPLGYWLNRNRERRCFICAPIRRNAGIGRKSERWRPEPVMQSGRVTTEGDELYHEVRGEAPPLLLIPGGGADGAAYSLIADVLADEFTVITYDRPCQCSEHDERTPELRG
jgi:hypothetical protein